MKEHTHDTFGSAVSRDEDGYRVSYHTCSICRKEMGEYMRVKLGKPQEDK